MILSPLSGLMRSGLVRDLGQSALMAMEPETAHRTSITALKCGMIPEQEEKDADILSTRLAGLDLSNPVGMAAGFDKNAEVPGPLVRMGFGMVEVGTITPRPQTGNPQPRLFRLPEHMGVINRMGFNNEGHDAALERLQDRDFGGVLGINVGANKDSDDFIADYVMGVDRFAPLADYLTANISSPNTPGLRDLQQDEALKRLLDAVLNARDKATRTVPLFLKLAPDLDETQMDAIAKVVTSKPLDGLIMSNTTLGRDQIAGHRHAGEAGGLSGKPLFEMSTKRLAQMRQRVGDLPIIGVGGIHSAQSAIAKFEAGANAIQLYSALVFGGLTMIEEIKAGLASEALKRGLTSIGEMTGVKTNEWAQKSL